MIRFLRNHSHRQQRNAQSEESLPQKRRQTKKKKKTREGAVARALENADNFGNINTLLSENDGAPTNRPRTNCCGTQDLSLADEVFLWQSQPSQEEEEAIHISVGGRSSHRIQEDGFATPSTPPGFPMAIVLHSGMERPRSTWELLILQCIGVIRDTPQWYTKVRDAAQLRVWKGQAGTRLETELTRICQGHVSTIYKRFEELWLQSVEECQYLACIPHQQLLSSVDHVYANDFQTLQNNNPVNNRLGEPLGQRIRRNISRLRTSFSADAADHESQFVHLVDPSLYAYRSPHNDDNSVGNPMKASKMVAPPFSQVLGTYPMKTSVEKSTPSCSFFPTDTICRSQFISPTGLQWLPSEFYVHEDENDGCLDCQINSYINSLHPQQHEPLYCDLEQLFCLAVPLLEQALTEVSCVPTSDQRVSLIRERELRVPVPSFKDYQRQKSALSVSVKDVSASRLASLVSIPTFEKPHKEDDLYSSPRTPQVSLRDRPLQVVVRVTNMELQPFSNETYLRGEFNVEGMMDDRIVATACCCVENDNIELGDLEFRTSVWEPNCDDERYNITFSSITDEVEQWRTHVFGLRNGDRLVQPRGVCSSREGRILAWPNTLQHRLTPARLVDRTQPGRRTWVEYFLVDPTLRIPSTATVPPQQLHWLEAEWDETFLASHIGERANRRQILNYLISFPDNPFLTNEQAKARRQELRNERAVTGDGDTGLVDQIIMAPNPRLEQWEMDSEEDEGGDEFFAPNILEPSFSVADEDITEPTWHY